MLFQVFGLLFLVSFVCHAQQEVGLKLGKTTIPVNQAFTITLSIEEDLPGNIIFPDIKGLQKQGVSTSSSTTIVNGAMTSSNSITQRYVATAKGSYKLPAFSMTVLGKRYSAPAATITFTDEVSNQTTRTDPMGFDPFEDFFGSSRGRDYVNVKEDAFLSLASDKASVYAGEGFNLKLSLFVAEDNKADMDFYNLTTQLSNIIKQIKPTNCWEENFGITEIESSRVMLNGKPYSEYKIWQAELYPLNNQAITFPKVSMELIKYRVSRDPFFSGLDRQKDYKTFYTKPFTVTVKPLPPHPKRGSVAVGDFHLVEGLGQNRIMVGQSTAYDFTIKGEGNISSISLPDKPTTDQLDIYPPSINQNIYRGGGHVTGQKQFSFLLQPKVPEKIGLAKNGFNWVFFNPVKGRYDSLVSRLSLTAFGQRRTASADQPNTVANRNGKEDNRLIFLDQTDRFRYWANIALGILALLSIATLWVRKA